MIKFKDFNIKTKQLGGFITPRSFESVDESLLRMNNWIEEKEIMVLNVETLLIPDDSTKLGAYKVSSDMSSWWHQIFRVWYQA